MWRESVRIYRDMSWELVRPINIAKLNAVAQSRPLSRFTLYRFRLVKREHYEGGSKLNM